MLRKREDLPFQGINFSSSCSLFTAVPIGRSSNVFRRESRIMEASPATATRSSGIATSQKNCLRIPDFARARFFLSTRKSQFFWDVLHFGAEWRGCLLSSPPRGLKDELVAILSYLLVFPLFLSPSVCRSRFWVWWQLFCLWL